MGFLIKTEFIRKIEESMISFEWCDFSLVFLEKKSGLNYKLKTITELLTHSIENLKDFLGTLIFVLQQKRNENLF